MQTVLIVIHLMVAVSLIVIVLLQRSEGGALGIGGSGSGLGGLFSPRGAASTLTRTTAILGFLFLLTSLSLTYLSLGTRRPTSILDTSAPGQTAPAGAPKAPAPAGGAPQLPQFPTVPPTR
jgi:preprotein translocase subunit SecG